MNYQEAREKFQDGDIVFFSNGRKNFVRRVITWFSNGPHYHVGIAFWATIDDQRRLCLAEAQPGGYRIVNLAFYKDRDMTVLTCPVPWKRIADEVVSSAGVIGYGFSDLVLIGLHEKIGLPIPDKADGPGDVCSAVVAKMLRYGGLNIATMVSPQRLLDSLVQITPCRFIVTAK